MQLELRAQHTETAMAVREHYTETMDALSRTAEKAWAEEQLASFADQRTGCQQ